MVDGEVGHRLVKQVVWCSTLLSGVNENDEDFRFQKRPQISALQSEAPRWWPIENGPFAGTTGALSKRTPIQESP